LVELTIDEGFQAIRQDQAYDHEKNHDCAQPVKETAPPVLT
jgi:hypothetical protein